jgi:hypothetical protein
VVVLLAVAVPAADPPAAPVVAKLPAAAAVLWLPGNEHVATADERTVRVWDWAKQKEVAAMPRPTDAGRLSAVLLARCADGRRIAVLEGDRLLRVWDRTTNDVKAFPVGHVAPPAKGILRIAFAPDGNTLRVLTDRHVLQSIGADGKAADPPVQMPTQFGTGERALIRDEAVVSPAAGVGVAYYEGFELDEVRVWDYRANAVRTTLELRENSRPYPWAISPDGRTVVMVDHRQARPDRIGVYDTDSLQPLFSTNLSKDWKVPPFRGFSPDGRLFALETSLKPETVTIHDARFGQPLARVVSEDEAADSRVVISDDGRRVALIRRGGQTLIHDLRAALDPTPPATLDAAACWNDLVSPDATTALRAAYRLADHPTAAMKLIREKLKPVASPTAADVTVLVKALSAPAFAERQAAAKKLAVVADAAAAELKQAAAKDASPEAAEAIKTLLETAARSRRKLEGDYLRAYRAVQALEMIGPPAADALKEYAAGAKGAFLTQEAAAARGRMK